jgi:hypothetical protein
MGIISNCHFVELIHFLSVQLLSIQQNLEPTNFQTYILQIVEKIRTYWADFLTTHMSMGLIYLG